MFPSREAGVSGDFWVPKTWLQPKIQGPLPRVTLDGDLPSATTSPGLTTFHLLSSLTWTHCL